MIFSPDFLAYFAHTHRVYAADPSVYCVSSWNDNGRRGLVGDANRLLRTDFFIGLGWLASRAIYRAEFERQWPPTHWDHWMREPQQRKGRVCVYPEVRPGNRWCTFNLWFPSLSDDQGCLKC